jgi:hypothetical protein
MHRNGTLARMCGVLAVIFSREIHSLFDPTEMF